MKELLFILKYRREGLAYEIWRQGTMTRASIGKEFPGSVEKAIPELFEKQQAVRIRDLPPDMQRMFIDMQQESLDRRFSPK